MPSLRFKMSWKARIRHDLEKKPFSNQDKGIVIITLKTDNNLES